MKRLISVFLVIALGIWTPVASAAEPFRVAAKGAVLIDQDSGRVLFAQNADQRLPMASTTKVMTTLLALENAALSDRVTAGRNAVGVPGTSLYLSEGETLSLEHMLYGLMLRSGNDAAVAVAEHIAGSVPAFADMMNAKAKAIGANAHFVNPHGLDAEGHGISALGLALVMRQAMKNESFRKITGTQRKIIPWVGNEYSRVLENKNRLLKTYEGATGGKTGYTGKAGRCLVFSAQRDGLSLIGAVLNCPTWFDTATALLDYGFENFRTESALEDGQPIEAVTVNGGVSTVVNAIAGAPLRAAVPIGIPFRIVHDLPRAIEAPVRLGQTLGTARLVVGGRVLAECKLIAGADVQKRDLRTSIIRLLRGWILRLQA